VLQLRRSTRAHVHTHKHTQTHTLTDTHADTCTHAPAPLPAHLQEAQKLLESALQLCKRTLGPQHPMSATVMNNLGEALARQKRIAEAEPLVRQALKVCVCACVRARVCVCACVCGMQAVHM